MALLTADDVLNKKFQPTKFREGYDQDEVDDFLDEIVNTLRVVGGENEELKARLEEAQRRIAELGGEPTGVDVAGVQDTQQLSAVVEPEAEEAPAEEPAAEAEPGQAEAPAQAESFAPPAAAVAAGGNEPESATGMLQLAQRLHDEYVSNGKAEAEAIVSEARIEGEKVIGEADEQRSRTLNQLEGERSLLERKIDELRVFERDYRTRLKSFLEGLLSDVEGRGNVSSAYGIPGPESDVHRP